MAEAYKVLGQSNPTTGTSTDLYTVAASTEAIASSIVVCNRSATGTSFRISVAPNGIALAESQYLYYDTTIGGNDTIVATIGLTLDASDKVRVYSNDATLTFSLFGMEITA